MLHIPHNMSLSSLLIIFLIFGVSCFPAPQQYSRQSDLMTGFDSQPFRMMYSPDMSSLAYIPSRYSSAIKFRSSMWSSSQTTIKTTYQVEAISFDPKGDRLYAITTIPNGTYFTVYYYTISNKSISQTQRKLFDSITTNYTSESSFLITVSNAGYISIAVDKYFLLYVLSVNRQSASLRSLFDRKQVIYDMEWHPTQVETLVLGSCHTGPYLPQTFLFYRFNTTTGTFYQLASQNATGVAFLLDGSVLLQSNSSGTYIYGYYSNVTVPYVALIDKIEGFQMNSSSVSVDRSSFVAWNSNGDVRVYRFDSTQHESRHFVTGGPYILIPNQQDPNPSPQISIRYKLLMNVQSSSSLKFSSISPSANQVFFFKSNNTYLQRYSRCNDGQYYSNQHENDECIACSVSCKTCLLSSFQCTSCPINSVLTQNADCLKCSAIMAYCAVCSQAGAGVKCNQCYTGFEYMDSTQSCVCPAGHQIVGNLTCQQTEHDKTQGIQLWEFILGFVILVIINVLIGYGVYDLLKNKFSNKNTPQTDQHQVNPQQQPQTYQNYENRYTAPSPLEQTYFQRQQNKLIEQHRQQLIDENQPSQQRI